ncbi:hypothetical protein C2G38_2192352 [Gigaspora rosea]|uniref:Uncharacterized protein n=1 Tax=Gigaspora rosea TaxID=44941 RepID=A0A397V843_9GLOM|nr:hypothetical protein C2G38_2192352 [Gigaspora rosea]
MRRCYKAFLDLNKALDINPLDMATLLYLGEAYFNHGHYNKAFHCLGRFHEAFVDFNEALKIEPNNIDILILRGEAYLNLEHYYNAHSDFDKAIKILPQM